MPDYPVAIPRRNWEKHGERPSVCDWGVKTDGIVLTDGAIQAGDNTFTSASAAFAAIDIGKTIWIEGAGLAGLDLLTTIADYIDSTSVQTMDEAGTTVTGVLTRYGVDSTAQLQAAFNESLGYRGDLGFRLQFPRGRYLTTASIVLAHNLCIDGQGFSYHVYNHTSPSLIMCCADVPALAYNDASGDGLKSCVIQGLSLNGTRRSGSKGIYTARATGFVLRDCTFDHFGDQAVHLEGGIFDNRLYNLHAVGSCLVRSRAAFVGVIDIGQSDVMLTNCIASASCSHDGVNPIPAVAGDYGDGKIAAFAIRSDNCFMSDCFGHHAQFGIYVLGNFNIFANVRGDNNQGEDWIVDGSSNRLIGCRGFSSSQDSDGGYTSFLVNGAGNSLDLVHVAGFGYGAGSSPLYNRYKHGIEVTNADITESNRILHPYILSNQCLDVEFSISGTQVNTPYFDLTAFDPNGRKTARVKADLKVYDDDYIHHSSLADADEANYRQSLNVGSGFSQLLFQFLSDDYLSVETWMQVDRNGMVVNFVRFPNSRVEFHGGDIRIQHDTGEIIFTTAAGVPRQILAAYGGTGPGNGTPNAGDLLVGNFSSEWDRLAAAGGFLHTASGSGVLGYQAVDLATASGHVTGTLPLINGGLNATTAAGGRTTLSVYSKADIDGMVAAIYAAIAAKATAGVATGVASGHTHQQNP